MLRRLALLLAVMGFAAGCGESSLTGLDTTESRPAAIEPAGVGANNGSVVQQTGVGANNGS